MSFDVYEFLKFFDFKNIRRRGENFMASCPDFYELHSRGDIRPSFGIQAFPPFLSNCFACGVQFNIEQLTAKLLTKKMGRSFNEYDAWVWLEKKGWYLDKGMDDLKMWAEGEKDEDVIVYEDSILDQFTYGVHHSIFNRGITSEAAREWELRHCSKTARTIIPVRNSLGFLLGVMTRAVSDDAYIRHSVGYPCGEELKYKFKKSLVLFGENKIKRKNTLLLIESPLELIYCWSCGIQDDMDILATMSAKATKLQVEKIKGYNEILIGLDNDEAGSEGRRILEKQLEFIPKLKNVKLPEGSDIGDLSGEQIKNIRELAEPVILSKLNSID